MSGADIIACLKEALGNNLVLSGENIPIRNYKDWSTVPPTKPLSVVMPVDTAGVATTMKLCTQHGISVVPQGGLTGLCGGATPSSHSIALSLERFTGIEEIDAAAATMTVRAGTSLQVVQKAAEDAGFFMPLDLGSRGSCSVGGNLATNAGGNRVIRYGMTRDMVLGLEVVLPDGTVLTNLNKMIKNNAGYDLKQLFIGSEGTLGIITRIVLRLFPPPACVSAALCAVDSYDQVIQLLRNARQGLGPLLSAFEVMWPDYWDTITSNVPGVRNPFIHSHSFYVLVESHGFDETIDHDRVERWMEKQLVDGIIADAAMARSLADVRDFWRVRDAASEFIKIMGPHEAFDIGLRQSDMDKYVHECRYEMQKQLPGIVACFYGHIGDGNLHIVACLPNVAEQPKETIQRIVYETLLRFQGSISAEHGIGTTKKQWLPFTRSAEELALMRKIKTALDPKNLLNPGKVV